MSGLSVIPPGFTPALLKPQPAWLKFRTRSSYSSGSPAVPGDFLTLPNGQAAPANALALANFTWITNVGYPFVLAYRRSAMRWTFQGVSAKRLSIVHPPWSGPAPLQVAPFASTLIPNLSEVRLVVSMAWSGGSGVGGGFSFTGFTISDWNVFGGGSSGSPWPDLSANSYIGLLIDRTTGQFQIAMKRAGTAGRTILAAPAAIAADVPFVVDHRFTAATLTRAAHYSVRINAQLVAEFSFDAAGAPVYANNGDGLAPGFYSSFFDTGGSTRYEDFLQLDCLAGPGANSFAID